MLIVVRVGMELHHGGSYDTTTVGTGAWSGSGRGTKSTIHFASAVQSRQEHGTTVDISQSMNRDSYGMDKLKLGDDSGSHV